MIGLGAIDLAAIISLIYNENKTVSASVIAACTTGLISVLSVLIAKHIEHEQQIGKELRIKKAEVYEALLVMNSKGLKNMLEDKGQDDFFAEFPAKIICWGNSEIVELYKKWRTTIAAQSMISEQNQVFLDLLIAMRRDLGNTSRLEDKTIIEVYSDEYNSQ